MERTRNRIVWGLVVLLVLVTETHAAFRLETVPEEWLKPVQDGGTDRIDPNSRWVGGVARASYMLNGISLESLLRDLNVKELPKGAQDVHVGRIALDFVNPILLVVYATEQGGISDTVVFDLNGDGDLTNDPVITGFAEEPDYDPFINDGPDSFMRKIRVKEIELPIPNGSTSKVRVILKDGVRVQTNLYLRGKSVLNGQEIDTVIDCSKGGLASEFNNRGPRIQLDINHDGKFGRFESMGAFGEPVRSTQEEFILPRILFQGVLYEGTFDKTRMELNWTRCPQGKLDLKFENVPKITSWFYAFEDSGWKIFADSERESQIVLKAGEVCLNAHLYLKTKSGNITTINFSADPPLTIRDGKTTTLTIGKPIFEITLSQSDSRLIVGRVFKTPNGTMKIWGKLAQFVIRDDKGRQLTRGEGVSNWGKEGFDYAWTIPPTLKKGDRLKVSVTWETEPFGKLEAEKECVLGDPDGKTAENL